MFQECINEVLFCDFVVAWISSQLPEQKEGLLESGRRFQQLNFSKAPWSKIQSRLQQVNWGTLESIAKVDVTAGYKLFINTILPILELVPPIFSGKKFGKSRRHKTRRCLWRKLARIKQKLHKTSCISRAALLLKLKQDLELKLKKSYETQSREEESKVVDAMKTNVKAFYAYSRARQKTKARVGPFLDPDTGVPNPYADYAAKVLSDQYSSVFTPTRPEYKVEDLGDFFSGGTEWRQEHEGRPLLVDIKFTKHDIEWACRELISSSSPGPDGVPALLLKTACKELSHPLYLIWRASMDQGVIPADLLLALISPVHKGGSRSSPAN